MYVFHDLTQNQVPMMRQSDAWFDYFFGSNVISRNITKTISVYRKSKLLDIEGFKEGVLTGSSLEKIFKLVFCEKTFLDGVDVISDLLSFYTTKLKKEIPELNNRIRLFLLGASWHETAGTLNPLELKAEQKGKNILWFNPSRAVIGSASKPQEEVNSRNLDRVDYGVGPCHLQETFNVLDAKGKGVISSEEYKEIYERIRSSIFKAHHCESYKRFDEKVLQKDFPNSSIWRGRPSFFITPEKASILKSTQSDAFYGMRERALLSENPFVVAELTVLEFFRSSRFDEARFSNYGATTTYPSFAKICSPIARINQETIGSSITDRLGALSLINLVESRR